MISKIVRICHANLGQMCCCFFRQFCSITCLLKLLGYVKNQYLFEKRSGNIPYSQTSYVFQLWLRKIFQIFKCKKTRIDIELYILFPKLDLKNHSFSSVKRKPLHSFRFFILTV